MTPNFRHVLFLCTGNYYRSRYAEYIFNHKAKSLDLEWRAFSRGAAERGSPNNVGPISRFALDALISRGVAVDLRNPMPCNPKEIGEAQIVIALKKFEHRPMIERRFPEVAGAVQYWNVDDVEFLEPAVALSQIDRLVDELVVSLSALK